MTPSGVIEKGRPLGSTLTSGPDAVVEAKLGLSGFAPRTTRWDLTSASWLETLTQAPLSLRARTAKSEEARVKLPLGLA